MFRNEIPWLSSLAESWRLRAAQGRAPHAVLIDGKPGSGKRILAGWLAGQHLDRSSNALDPAHPLEIPAHADLHWLAPEEGKHSIGVDQVRSLIAKLELTSYTGGGKAAVIEPANAMTDSAANSLLKTLEEPSGDSLIVLVVDQIGRLPATIFSRCQRITVGLPSEREATDWLRAVDAATDWQTALRLAGGAPLAALDIAGRVDEAMAMAAAFSGLADGRGSPMELAGQWAKMEPGFVLDLLAGQVQACIKQALLGKNAVHGKEFPESVIRHIDRRNLFCYLDIINRLRGQAPGSFNVALTLESLLIEWSSGLKTCRNRFGPGELLPGTVTG